MGGSTKKTPKSKTTKWSDAFARTAGLPCVFTVHWSHYGEVRELVKSLELPGHHQGGLFSTWYWATAILDGYVLENSTEGFPAGRLPSGIRVVGSNPLRLLCYLLDLTQPRRRSGESEVPSFEDLKSMLVVQQSAQTEALGEDLESMLFADTTADLTLLAYKLYEAIGLPNPKAIPWDAASKIPGPDAWGAAGLSMYDFQHLGQSGLTVDEARQWVKLTAPYQVERIIADGVTLDEALRWQDEGVDVIAVAALKAVEATPDEVKEWLALGGFDGNFAIAKERNVTASQVRPFMELGYSDLAAIKLVEHTVSVEVVRGLDEVMQPKPWDQQIIVEFAIRGMKPATLAEWMASGINPGLMKLAVEKSIAVEDVQALVTAGKSRQQIEDFIKKR
jgi:hypothetical protein